MPNDRAPKHNSQLAQDKQIEALFCRLRIKQKPRKRERARDWDCKQTKSNKKITKVIHHAQYAENFPPERIRCGSKY